MAIHPEFVAAFVQADQPKKQAMIARLCDDWLAAKAAPFPVDHCAALLDLLAQASSARQVLIEQVVVEHLTRSLCAAETNWAAAKAAAAWMERHPSCIAPFIDATDGLLSTLPSTLRLHDGLDHLASFSPVAREHFFPSLLDKRAAAFASERPSFASVARCHSDLAKLRGLLQSSPYSRALQAAFFPAASRSDPSPSATGVASR